MVLDNYQQLKKDLGDVDLVVVTKYQEIDKIEILYEAGVRLFGENRVEALVKRALLFPEAHFHMIGRLQTNKVRKLIGHCSLIHSVDSLKLLQVIDKEAAKKNLVQDVLLQVNLSNETTKAGFSEIELKSIINVLHEYVHVNVCGLMMMAPFTEDRNYLSELFQEMYELFQKFDFKILSMGMSNDYEIALQKGATMVRIGSKIFKTKELL